jgi:hypothetical protein
MLADLHFLPVLIFGEVDIGPELRVGGRLADQVVLQFGGSDTTVDNVVVNQLKMFLLLVCLFVCLLLLFYYSSKCPNIVNIFSMLKMWTS